MAEFNRAENAARNLVFGSLAKAYQLIMPFIMRTAMIYYMGVEYLGLNSLFASVLQVLNLAELGVGSAMIFSMYRPIAEDDYISLCALLRLYRFYYRIIGLAIATIGLALTPLVPALIRGNVPAELNVYILYWMNLGLTVISYWLFAYKNSLLVAYQRSDITSKVSLATSTFQYVTQLLVILVLKDYYVYIICAMATQVLSNVVNALCASRLFPDITPKGKLSIGEKRDINKRIRDLFTSKVGYVAVNSVDTIVISAFLGLAVLAVYQNYFFVVTSVTSFVGLLLSASTAGVGNSLAVESKSKNYYDFGRLTLIVAWAASFSTCCMVCLYQPFMEIWVGKSLMLDFSAVVLFCIYYYVQQLNALFNMYKDAGGIWRQDRFRPLCVSAVNLVLNIAFVQVWGIYGVLLSTVIATLLVGEPWLFYNLFTCLFEVKMLKGFLKDLACYTAVAGLCATCCILLSCCFDLPLWPTLFLRLGICLIVPNCVFYLVFHRKKEFAGVADVARRLTRKASIASREFTNTDND